MKKLIAAAGIALLPLLAACSSPPKSGTVTEKAYDDPDTWVAEFPIFTTIYTGKYPTTIITGWIPITEHDGPHWWVHLQDDKDPKHTGWVEVDQGTYNSDEIGSHYP